MTQPLGGLGLEQTIWRIRETYETIAVWIFRKTSFPWSLSRQLRSFFLRNSLKTTYNSHPGTDV